MKYRIYGLCYAVSSRTFNDLQTLLDTVADFYAQSYIHYKDGGVYIREQGKRVRYPVSVEIRDLTGDKLQVRYLTWDNSLNNAFKKSGVWLLLHDDLNFPPERHYAWFYKRSLLTDHGYLIKPDTALYTGLKSFNSAFKLDGVWHPSERIDETLRSLNTDEVYTLNDVEEFIDYKLSVEDILF